MTLCVSYQRSIEKLCLPPCGSYGVVSGDDQDCQTVWDKCQRNNWYDALAMAQSDIQRDLTAPLCPQEICGEVVRPVCQVTLKFKPVAYLGQKVYTDWVTATVEYDEATGQGTVTLCDVDYAEINENNLVVAYPDRCRPGSQTLEQPCITRFPCEGDPDTDGLLLEWPTCQLADPDEDSVTLSGAYQTPPVGFLQEIRYRTWSIDEDLAYELVGQCQCRVCRSSNPTYSVTLVDATAGIICIEGINGCLDRTRRLRINYATAYNCGDDSLDESLEQAVVLLALLKQGRPNQLCGCDQFTRIRDGWLERDPDANQPLVTPGKLLYGGTRAGLEIQRTVNKAAARLRFDSALNSGGNLSANRSRGFRKAVGRW